MTFSLPLSFRLRPFSSRGASSIYPFRFASRGSLYLIAVCPSRAEKARLKPLVRTRRCFAICCASRPLLAIPLYSRGRLRRAIARSRRFRVFAKIIRDSRRRCFDACHRARRPAIGLPLSPYKHRRTDHDRSRPFNTERNIVIVRRIWLSGSESFFPFFLASHCHAVIGASLL